MRPTLHSKESIARETGLDRRVVSRALEDVAADGVQAGRPTFFLRTALRALGLRQANGRASVLSPITSDRADLIALERAHDALQQGFAMLLAEPSSLFAVPH